MDPWFETSPTATWHDETPVRVGISACLLGESVRWNGGHKRDAFACEELSRYVEWVSVCPEVAVGMSVPRETLRLEADGEAIRVVATRSGHDHTAALGRYASAEARRLRGAGLCGFLFKARSPSCGVFRVKVWNDAGQPEARGRGVFAEAVTAGDPGLPVEEEGRLRDAALRERFVERVFATHRVHSLFRGRATRGRIVAFHAAHKLQLMAHHQTRMRALGALVAQAKSLRPSELRERYVEGFAVAMARPASRRSHTNVLQHIQGYFRKRLSAGDRSELGECIDRYHRGFVPLVVPLTLLRHHVRREGIDYLAAQVYLEPHPSELMLRNHV